MRYLTFGENPSGRYTTAVLVPTLVSTEIKKFYLDDAFPVDQSRVIAYDLHKGHKRTPVAEQREYLADLIPTLQELKVETLIVGDAEYFKTLTGAKSTDKALGYALDVIDMPGVKAFYVPNFRQVFYNPEKVEREIKLGISAFIAHNQGTYQDPGEDIIKHAEYHKSTEAIEDFLEKLLAMDCDLTCDIEGFSLNHYTSGIGTIAFAWNKHEGGACAIDYLGLGVLHSNNARGKSLRTVLLNFFYRFYQSGRKMIYHNISYDVYALIYQLFMRDLLDQRGMLQGIEVMLGTNNWHCTQLLSYLATNSTAGNHIGLKAQSHEYTGNYAVEEIEDITRVPIDDLLEYNLVDCLATWYVFEKNMPIVVRDDQLEIYDTIFRDATIDIVQMQLTGLPLDMEEVLRLSAELTQKSEDLLTQLANNTIIQQYVAYLNQEWVDKRNATLKTKVEVIENANQRFNPNSPPQLQALLYSDEFLGLNVIARTKTKAPATGGKILKKLKDQTQDARVLELLDLLIDYKEINKVLTDFLPNFRAAPRASDGWYYLFGKFKLGGTVSGRLSSNGPNLQNIPAQGWLGKAIKKCFKAPPGWIFVGLDFASLEDRISALITKDPNKLKVYTDGYDGHSLRAQSYFAAEMPDIDPNDVDSINSIADKYPEQRQRSKGPTFLLTYGGTNHGMQAQFNMSLAEAVKIEMNYHTLYKVSDEWVADQIAGAAKNGFLTVAFGLRVRTPLLKQTILGTSNTPYQAESEGRTAGNATGQSWGLLNSRAASAFMKKTRADQNWRYLVRPCAHIHDAQYYMIPAVPAAIDYVNQTLPPETYWQDHDAIRHPDVCLGGNLSIFYPSWAEETELPNDADYYEIDRIATELSIA